MRNRMRVHTSKLITCTALVVLAAVASACTSKSGVSLNGQALNPSNSANFTLTSVNGTAPANFTLVANGSNHPAIFGTYSYTILGSCDRGVAFLAFAGTGVPANTVYTCSVTGSANFSYTVPSVDGEYDFTITPYGSDGNASGAVTNLQIYAKGSNPNPITFGLPAAANAVTPGGSFIQNAAFTPANNSTTKLIFVGGTTGTLAITGNYSTTNAAGAPNTAPDYITGVYDTTSGLGCNPTLTPSGGGKGTWTCTVNIKLGESPTFTFVVKDSLGHSSSAYKFAFSSNDEILPPAPGGAVLAGAGAGDVVAGSGHTMTAFTSMPILGKQTSGSSTLYFGVPAIGAQGPQ